MGDLARKVLCVSSKVLSLTMILSGDFKGKGANPTADSYEIKERHFLPKSREHPSKRNLLAKLTNLLTKWLHFLQIGIRLIGCALSTDWFFTHLLSSFPSKNICSFVSHNSFPFMPQMIRCYHVIYSVAYYRCQCFFSSTFRTQPNCCSISLAEDDV